MYTTRVTHLQTENAISLQQPDAPLLDQRLLLGLPKQVKDLLQAVRETLVLIGTLDNPVRAVQPSASRRRSSDLSDAPGPNLQDSCRLALLQQNAC